MSWLTIVVDLDGTLCDSRHREHHAVNKDWDAFHSGISEDEKNDDVAWAVNAFARAGARIIACTGRPEKYRPATERWLVEKCIPVEEVLMRANDDFRPDGVVKVELIKLWNDRNLVANGVAAHHRTLFVLDDRESVVEAWRAAGFVCWQVRQGGY